MVKGLAAMVTGWCRRKDGLMLFQEIRCVLQPRVLCVGPTQQKKAIRII